MRAEALLGGSHSGPEKRWWGPGLERCWWRWGDWGVLCRQSTGLANELDVQVRGREEPRIIPNIWFEKLADGGGTFTRLREKAACGKGRNEEFCSSHVRFDC